MSIDLDLWVAGEVTVEQDGERFGIPLLNLPWLDERTGCTLAHYELAGLGVADLDVRNCSAFQGGWCTLNGEDPPRSGQYRSRCLFFDLSSASWDKVRRWRLVVDGDHSYISTAASAYHLADEDPNLVVVGAPRPEGV